MNKVIALDLSEPKVKEIIIEIAKDSNKVFFSHHAEKRMKERKITRIQVIRCLLHGCIIEGPCRDDYGNWVQKLETMSAGDSVSVVIALKKDKKGDFILVITCY